MSIHLYTYSHTSNNKKPLSRRAKTKTKQNKNKTTNKTKTKQQTKPKKTNKDGQAAAQTCHMRQHTLTSHTKKLLQYTLSKALARTSMQERNWHISSAGARGRQPPNSHDRKISKTLQQPWHTDRPTQEC
jgi:hypothetical protein